MQYIRNLWAKLRGSKPIYSYGSIHFKELGDPRSLKEKIYCYIDNLLEKKKVYTKRNQVWHSYFDMGIGLVDSYNKIKQKEKEGYIYATTREIRQEAYKNKLHHQNTRIQKIKKHLSQNINKIIR